MYLTYKNALRKRFPVNNPSLLQFIARRPLCNELKSRGNKSVFWPGCPPHWWTCHTKKRPGVPQLRKLTLIFYLKFSWNTRKKWEFATPASWLRAAGLRQRWIAAGLVGKPILIEFETRTIAWKQTTYCFLNSSKQSYYAPKPMKKISLLTNHPTDTEKTHPHPPPQTKNNLMGARRKAA